MFRDKINGSDLLCSVLERLGVDCVFGLPGTQSLEIYEALRTSSIRTVLATHELAATFMANGYFRASGKVGVVLTIPGPGFTYALTGLAEAFLDSAAVLCFTVAPAKAPGKKFQLQAIDQRAMASPVVKKVFRIETVSSLAAILAEAYNATLEDEPGPVLVEIESSVLTESSDGPASNFVPTKPMKRVPDPILLLEAMEILKTSSRSLLYLGQGAFGAAGQVRRLAELLQAPVLTTVSGRGVIPEDHPLSMHLDSGAGGLESANELIESCDLVLALACKFSHAGAYGFHLRLPSKKLIHIDASPAVLDANYPARLAIAADITLFLDAILGHHEIFAGRAVGWSPEDIQRWRDRIHGERSAKGPEPRFSAMSPRSPAAFFEALNRALPASSSLVTDSGLHQMLTRRYFMVSTPRALILPTNFQSMGFGIPSAIGMKLAAPERAVAVIVGDGGFALSGLELLTAVREKIPLVVIVFNDGALNLIRLGQLGAYGWSHSTEILNSDFSLFAKSVGAEYVKLKGNPEEALRGCLNSPAVTLLEVELEDSPDIGRMRTIGRAKRLIRRFKS